MSIVVSRDSVYMPYAGVIKEKAMKSKDRKPQKIELDWSKLLGFNQVTRRRISEPKLRSRELTKLGAKVGLIKNT